MDISLPKLRNWQKEFFKNAKRFNVLVLHRRAGKTVGSILFLLTKALGAKGSYGYIAPTYKQAKAIAWDMLVRYTQKIPGTQINISEMKVTLMNGSTIRLFGADNPDSLRGLDLRGVIFDEYAQQPSNIYSEIIFPMLVVNNGWATWIGTPKGQNAFWELYNKGLGDESYNCMLLTVKETDLLNDEQLRESKKEMTEDEFQQEFMCSWTASIKGAYYSKELSTAYEEKRIVKSIYDKLLPVYTFWDLGISDYTTIGFAQIVGQEVRIIDYLQKNGESLDYYCNYVLNKGYRYEAHYFPHDIEVRELGSGLSRLEIVKKMLGDNCRKVKNIGIKDGIDALRIIFYKLWFDEDTTGELRNCLANYTQEWDDRSGMFKDKPLHNWASHGSDMMRYLAVAYRDLTEPVINTIFETDYSDFI